MESHSTPSLPYRFSSSGVLILPYSRCPVPPSPEPLKDQRVTEFVAKKQGRGSAWAPDAFGDSEPVEALWLRSAAEGPESRLSTSLRYTQEPSAAATAAAATAVVLPQASPRGVEQNKCGCQGTAATDSRDLKSANGKQGRTWHASGAGPGGLFSPPPLRPAWRRRPARQNVGLRPIKGPLVPAARPSAEGALVIFTSVFGPAPA